MRSLEAQWRATARAIVLLNERRARRIIGLLRPTSKSVPTRAFFRVLTEDFGLNDTAAYCRLRLNNIGDMDVLNENRRVRAS